MKAAGAMLGTLVALVVFILMVTAPEPGDPRCSPAPPVATTSPTGKVRPMKAGTYTLTSGFGTRGNSFHRGLDWAAAPGTPIYAAAAGVVAEAGPASGFGMWVVLDHNPAVGVGSTVYGHMFDSDILVATGQQVSAGQPIARVGYNGETDPQGPGGAHLHFETYAGGTRFSGGIAVDPTAWLADAAEPGTAEAQTSPSVVPSPLDAGVAAPVSPAPVPSPLPDTRGTELAVLPPEKGSEQSLQPGAVRLVRILAARFPQVQRFGGWRASGASDPVSDHAEGRAIDVMIPDYLSGEGKALGDNVTDYVMANAAQLGVEYSIWRGIYRDSTGSAQQMTTRGDDTADHYDHVHVTVSSDAPGPGAPAPAVASAAGSASGQRGCETAATQAGVDDLAEGAVPPEYEQWYRRAGTLCPQIKASLLAAQGKQESGFNPRAESSAGALGIAQFLPGTATSADPGDGQPYVIDADGNGTASVWEPADAIIGQGRYMCALARTIDGWIADGSVTTSNPLELYLAAYNAGEGAVLRSGGFPTGHSDYQTQTRPYVETILAQADRYSTVLS